MKFLGNIFWLIFGGLIISLYYFIIGVIYCITIIGIPFGVQLIKLAGFAIWPFGHDIHADTNDSSVLSLIMNVIWIVFGGIEIALIHLFCGIILCITLVGIPFGKQHFKMAFLALVPFGKKID